MYQKVILIGRIGDIESGFTKTQIPVTQYSVATSKSVKNKKTDSWEDITEWHRVVSFNKVAEIVCKNYEVGDVLQLEGELCTRRWVDRNDSTHYTTQIIVRDFPKKLPRYFTRDGKANGVSTQPAAQQSQPQVPNEIANPVPSFDSFDDDIPF
jgi:single-strand DNA-binding protein